MYSIWILTVINIVLAALVWVPGFQFWQSNTKSASVVLSTEQIDSNHVKDVVKVQIISAQESDALLEQYRKAQVGQEKIETKMCLLWKEQDGGTAALKEQYTKMSALGTMVQPHLDEAGGSLKVFFDVANQEAVLKVLEQMSAQIAQGQLEMIKWDVCPQE